MHDYIDNGFFIFYIWHSAIVLELFFTLLFFSKMLTDLLSDCSGGCYHHIAMVVGTMLNLKAWKIMDLLRVAIFHSCKPSATLPVTCVVMTWCTAILTSPICNCQGNKWMRAHCQFAVEALVPWGHSCVLSALELWTSGLAVYEC